MCKELYEKHIGLYRLSENDIHGEINKFTTSQKETMDAVLDHYGDKEPYWLRELVREEYPWKKAKGCNDSIITKESMFEYYSSLLDAEIDQEIVCTKLQKEEYDPEEDSIWESLL